MWFNKKKNVDPDPIGKLVLEHEWEIAKLRNINEGLVKTLKLALDHLGLEAVPVPPSGPGIKLIKKAKKNND